MADRYRIERELGRGGMATVYLARDFRNRRAVAIKVLEPELATVIGPERFLREIEISANLAHPHILPLYDSGESDGFLYYVMPFVEGESLRQRLTREQQLPIDQALRISTEVADALGYAHAQGLIHRDIKPENILLEVGHAVLADFGIARVISAAGGERITASGMAVGTPAYMSPEQAAAGNPDHRSDLYGLGCVLFEMLAGRAPFVGPTAESVIRQHLTADAPPVDTIRSSVPKNVVKAVQRVLAKAPADRYASSTDFAAAISAPSAAAPHHPPDNRRPDRRNLLITAAAILVLAGVYWLAAAIRRGAEGGAATTPRLVVLPFENLGTAEDESFADGLAEEITARLGSVQGVAVISRQSAIQYKETSKTPRQIGDELKVQFLLRGAIRWQHSPDGASRVRVTPQLIRISDDSQVWADAYEEPVSEVFTVQEAIASNVVSALGGNWLQTNRQMAKADLTGSPEAIEYYLRGVAHFGRRLADGEALTAVEMFSRAVGSDPGFSAAHAALARARAHLVWDGSRAEEYPRAAEALTRAVELAPSSTTTHWAQAYLSLIARKWDDALGHYEIVRRREPNNAEVLSEIGRVYAGRGDWEQAVSTWAAAVELDPRNQLLALRLGVGLHFLRRFPEAERYYDLAIATAPDVSAVYAYKTLLLLAADGDTRRAKEFVTAVGQRLGSISWVTGGVSVSLWSILGRDYVDQLERPTELRQLRYYHLAKAIANTARDEVATARAQYDSARVLFQDALATTARDTLMRIYASSHGRLGLAYAALGRKSDAMEQVTPPATWTVERDAFDGVRDLEYRARVHAMVGEEAQALDLLEELLRIPSWLSPGLLKLDPAWDPLRTDPRFKRLLTIQ